MKKLLMILAAVVMLLAVPVPTGICRDGGTRAFTALTYRIVDWNRITEDGVYDGTKIYGFPDNFKSIDELWDREQQKLIHSFKATVLEVYEGSVLVEPVEGEPERAGCDRIMVGLAGLEEIGAGIGSVVEISYTGGIMESYPAQVHAVSWSLIS